MDPTEPTPSKIRKVNVIAQRLTLPKFDHLPPDVICSEILVHIVANILYLPQLKYMFRSESGSDSESEEEVELNGWHGLCPEEVILWLSYLVEDVILENRFCECFYRESLPEGCETLQEKSLFGRFSRDPLRHPWFIFRSIQINHDDAGDFALARARFEGWPDLDTKKRSDWIPRFVFLNLKQVVFLKLPEIGDWKSIQPRSVPNLKRWNCWCEEMTEDVLDMSPMLVLSCPFGSYRRNHLMTLPRYTGTELMCLEIELDDWVDDEIEVLNSTSIVDNLKKLTLIGECFHLKTLPPLNSLEYLELQHVYCSDQAFSLMDCSLRTLILRDCRDLKSLMPRCLRTLVRLWFRGEDEPDCEEEYFVFDSILQNETLSSLRDLKVTVVQEFKFLWLCRSRGLRSLVVHYRREWSEDGNNLLIKGLDLRDVQYLYLSCVDIELVENGAPRDENRFVLLEKDSKIL